MKSKNEIFITVIAFLLIVLFTAAALSKLIAYHAFYVQLHATPLLKSFAGILAWLLPATELYAVILLLIPSRQKTGMILSLILMLLFSLYISLMLLFADKLPYSCGGVIQMLTWPQHLLFNIAFTLLSVLGIFLIRNREIESHLEDIEEYLSRKSGEAENL